MAVPASVVELSGFVGVSPKAVTFKTESSGWPPPFFKVSDCVLIGPDPTEEVQLPIEVWLVIACHSVKSTCNNGHDSQNFNGFLHLS